MLLGEEICERLTVDCRCDLRRVLHYDLSAFDSGLFSFDNKLNQYVICLCTEGQKEEPEADRIE